jgi:[ribosomal protein S5]-alanine N-acetyltransferase
MSPLLETPRLLLRQPAAADVPELVRLAGRREIADTTISVPHPYTERHAREWVAAGAGDPGVVRQLVWVLGLRSTEELIGAVGLRDIHAEHRHAELGLWIGVEHWGRGYGTEAVVATVRHAFETMDINRIHAHHMVRNPASGRVLEKAGFRREGLLRKLVCKWGTFEDVVILAILRMDWLRREA